MRLLTGPRGGVSIERRLLPSCDGGIALEQIFHGDGTRTVVTHAASVLTEISVLAGALSFPLACAEIAAPALRAPRAAAQRAPDPLRRCAGDPDDPRHSDRARP